MDDQREREDRWEAKQRRLIALLERHGAVDFEYRVDLGAGRFWWLRSDGSPALVASSRVLLSYAPASRSILMGWANPSIAAVEAVPEVAGLPASLDDCDAADAWGWAMRLGDASGADFLYHAPSAQMSLFLGLWGVREATADDALPPPQPPWPHVRQVLEALLERYREGQDVGPLARNYGRSFVEERAHHGGPFEAPLHRVGGELIGLAGQSHAALGRGLEALCARVERFEADGDGDEGEANDD